MKNECGDKIVILGLMSGTSGDGIDGSLVSFSDDNSCELLWHGSYAFNHDQFNRINSLMSVSSAIEVVLGSAYIAELYAMAVKSFQADGMPHSDFLAAHGQTVHHQPQPVQWDEFSLTGSLQLLNGSILAERCKIPVICNFREADMASGGQGAPLVPFADLQLFGRATKNDLAVVNIGGMANVTLIKGDLAQRSIVAAFDTGPGNIWMDIFMQKNCSQRYDKDGKLASTGNIIEPLLQNLLSDPYYQLLPPKSTGREYFNAETLHRYIEPFANASAADIMATLLKLTIDTILQSIYKFSECSDSVDIVLAGGGALNLELVRKMTESARGSARIITSDELGIPVMARESMAFAILGNSFIKGIPANVPLATGAAQPVILGQLHHAPVS